MPNTGEVDLRGGKMNKLKRLAPAWFLFVGLIVVANLANAQSSGTIEGTVKDPTGAVIANATVSAQNLATGVETTHTTNAAGLFVLELTPGDYKVQASAMGFQSIVHEKVTVDALANVPLDFPLNVGTANSQVTVTATVEGVHTDDATLGTTVRNEVYAALPLAMNLGVPRDPTSFIAFSPGVAALVLESAGPAFTSFNGARQEVNGLYFEGLPVTFSNQLNQKMGQDFRKNASRQQLRYIRADWKLGH